jgi:hypothetical protein
MTAMLVTLTLFAAGGPAVTYPGCHTEECTTGNGFWFAYQHTASSWYAAGGRERSGRPAGARGLQPEPLEQDFRAVLTLRQQGRGAWPVCG